MTAAHASSKHLAKLPEDLRSLYLPPAVKPERFAMGKPVKGRNEPSAIGGVAWVVSSVTGVPYDKVVESAWENTVKVFSLSDVEA